MAAPAPQQPKKLYLITGASSGLGLQLALAALRAGHAVVATCRDPAGAAADAAGDAGEVARLGGRWAALDVASPGLEAQLGAALAGRRPDVLVNNAGVALGATVEDTDPAAARRVLETNFLGPLRLARAVLPLMTGRGGGEGSGEGGGGGGVGGTIVNVSSTSGVAATPLLGAYCGSKSALDSLTECLRAEVAPLGVRVLLAQPGGLRGAFVRHGLGGVRPVGPAYRGTPAEAVAGFFAQVADKGAGPGDPAAAAARIVEAVDGTGMFAGLDPGSVFRIPLGREATGALTAKIAALQEALKLADVAASIDLDE